MDVINYYGNIIKNNLNKPNKALNLIKFGLSLEEKRTHLFPYKELPNSLKYLNQICLKYILEPLRHKDRIAMVNLFAPSEIIQAMDIYPLFVEAFSSFLSGIKCEDAFIDYEERCGLGETLCSYHKAFLGAVEADVIPKPKFSIVSSIICDANINTFRYASRKYDIPYYCIDVPYEYSKESKSYVVEQIKEMIEMIEDVMHEKLDMDKLKIIINNENKSKMYLSNYYKELRSKYFPNTLTIEMYKLFASHVSIGRQESLNFYEKLYEDIKNAPNVLSSTKRILWVHILPFYHEPLKKFFNFSNDFQILTCDLNFDYMEQMDVNNPLEALARKMILNQYNGNFQRKIDNILNMCDLLNVDGVINFCQWGCKQSMGGRSLLKEALKEKNIPFLSIDGDGVDRRNGSYGQTKTRVEAFLELLKSS